MLGTIRKIILVLIVTAVVVLFGLLGFNVYLNYKKTRIEEQKEKERQEAKAHILSVENINHLGMIDHETVSCQNCNSCQDCQAGEECLSMQPKLIFTRKVKEYIHDVLDSVIKQVNGEELEPDNYKDNVTPFLKRYNAVLYGAPGTGKTELVNELVHHLHEKFSNPEIRELTKEIEKIEEELKEARQQQLKVSQKSEETTREDKAFEQKVAQIIPPVFKIDGVQLQTGGAVTDQPNPEDKLRMIIEKCKKQYFDNAYSDKPYIVFIEEADQGKNVMTAEKGKLLEEFKNFLSTSEDKAGLRAKAQDPNSIIIIATNNFDQIDPAVVRRGRLGEKLNFN
ncbi:46062_t:CDS:2 [Gigaspora margarita]|uniref:46062_t:CDS:1 n=1 Tax=Gigaspora margarita TaxID=4874 RepID=A0ABM8VWW1_GIGMA|nr:46062_t:CDS:2 [Gigaspora margarita]